MRLLSGDVDFKVSRFPRSTVENPCSSQQDTERHQNLWFLNLAFDGISVWIIWSEAESNRRNTINGLFTYIPNISVHFLSLRTVQSSVNASNSPNLSPMSQGQKLFTWHPFSLCHWMWYPGLGSLPDSLSLDVASICPLLFAGRTFWKFPAWFWICAKCQLG